VATYRGGLVGHGPAGFLGQHPARPVAAGLPAAGAADRRPGSPGAARTVSRNGRPFIRIREPVTLPCRQL